MKDKKSKELIENIEKFNEPIKIAFICYTII